LFEKIFNFSWKEKFSTIENFEKDGAKPFGQPTLFQIPKTPVANFIKRVLAYLWSQWHNLSQNYVPIAA
jgi:hypothetical protein